jgi:Holliday junction resolvase RusA-like endonuclease
VNFQTLRVEGSPSPACRPRVSKWGTYYAKPYAEWLATCQRQMATQAAKLSGALWCAVEVVVQRPKTTKLEMPRGDVDNLVKAVLDGGTKAGVWGDDGQIELLLARKRWTEPGEEPGAIINCGELAA